MKRVKNINIENWDDKKENKSVLTKVKNFFIRG